MRRFFYYNSSRVGYEYLVDVYSPVEALSLMKLSSTAVNCIRVRRSSDNTEQDIGFAGNAIDSSALLAFVGAGDGFVTTYYNQGTGGSVWDKIQPSLANQPKIVSAGAIETLNGNPAIRFTSTPRTYMYSTVTPLASNGHSVFTVFARTAAIAGAPVYSFGTSNTVSSYRTIGQGISSASSIGITSRNTTTYFVDTASTASVQYLLDGIWNTSSREAWVNGVSIGTNTSTSNDFSSNTRQWLGISRDPNLITTTSISALVNEIIHFDYDISSLRALIRSNINGRYGTY